MLIGRHAASIGTTLSDLEWPFLSSRAIPAVAELLVWYADTTSGHLGQEVKVKVKRA